MNFLRNFLSVVFILVVGQLGFAGHEGGHGAMVLICPPGKNTKPIELFDFYQARDKWNLKIDLGDPNMDFMEKVDLALSRLHKLNPSREKLYKQLAKTFRSEAQVTRGKNFVDTSDVGTGQYPEGCQPPQNVAYQEDPTLPGDVRYSLKGEFFEPMDNDNKAGTIIHEIVLREVSHQVPAQMDTKFVRYFTALLSSNALESMSLKTYIETLQKLKFALGDAQNGVGIIVYGGSQEKPKHSVNATYAGNPVEYWDDNTVKNAQGAGNRDGGSLYFTGELFGATFTATPIETNYDNFFSKNGLPNYFRIEDIATKVFKVGDKTLTVDFPGSVLFTKNRQNEELIVIKGGTWRHEIDVYVKVQDSNGNVIRARPVAQVTINQTRKVIQVGTLVSVEKDGQWEYSMQTDDVPY